MLDLIGGFSYTFCEIQSITMKEQQQLEELIHRIHESMIEKVTHTSDHGALEDIHQQEINKLAAFIGTSPKQDKLLKVLQASHKEIYIDLHAYFLFEKNEVANQMEKSMEREFFKESRMVFECMSDKKPELITTSSYIYRYVLKNKIIGSINGKNYLIFACIITDDDLTGRELLSLLIGNTLYGNRKEFHTDVDRWGSRLIWPYPKKGSEVLLSLLTEEAIAEIDAQLNLDDLAAQINHCDPEEVIQLFPKTVRNLKLRNTLKNKFYVKSLP